MPRKYNLALMHGFKLRFMHLEKRPLLGHILPKFEVLKIRCWKELCIHSWHLTKCPPCRNFDDLLLFFDDFASPTLQDSDTPVPIMNVRGEVLKRVIEWCDHHREDPVTPEGQEPSKDNKNIDLTEWDAKFTGVHNKEIDQDTLNDILLAANFLEIQA